MRLPVATTSIRHHPLLVLTYFRIVFEIFFWQLQHCRSLLWRWPCRWYGHGTTAVIDARTSGSREKGSTSIVTSGRISAPPYLHPPTQTHANPATPNLPVLPNLNPPPVDGFWRWDGADSIRPGVSSGVFHQESKVWCGGAGGGWGYEHGRMLLHCAYFKSMSMGVAVKAALMICYLVYQYVSIHC
jgi:hypothetical protein